LVPGTQAEPFSALISLQGTFTLGPGALTCFHANGTGISSALVGGSSQLNGVARLDFSSVPPVGTVYTLVQGASSGTFSAWESNLSGVEGQFSYSSSAVTFTVTVSDALFHDSFELIPDGGACAAAFAN
jgi:hypothetical protein